MNMIIRKHNDIAFLLTFFLFASRSKGEFVKFGPCLVPREVTCPDPHIEFYLYTRKNKDWPQPVVPNRDALLESYYNPEHRNKIIIHGYNNGPNLTSLIDMKNGYLETGDFNVWLVDWSTVAAGPCYPIVVISLNYVGSCTAQLVHEIINISTAPPEELFHVIGFSMGAHVAGFVANNLRPYKLPRITGLDPALPLFTTRNKDRKLDKTDAKFVDVLHTDALVEGKLERCGHIDFYMNGGMEQPGCWTGNIIEAFRCCHHRAPAYFAESITSKVGFWGWPCKGFFHYLVKKCPPEVPTVLMGEYCNQNATGYFIIHTRARYPYAIGRKYTVINRKTILIPSDNSSSSTELVIHPGIIEKIKWAAYYPEIQPE